MSYLADALRAATRLLAPLPVLTICACAAIPEGRAAIDAVDVVGARSLDPTEIKNKIATAESPKFLGVLRGVANDYTIYDVSVLQRDLARVERYCRGHGFFEAHVRVGRVIHSSDDHVHVEIVVDEGPPMRNRQVGVEGLEGLPPDIAKAVMAAAKTALPKGTRFDEDVYAKARAIVEHELTDEGYAYAKVTAAANAALTTHAIDYAFAVTPGIPAVFGPIAFVGLDPDGAGPAPQEIEEPILRRVVGIGEGQPYSTKRTESATQALLDLEVFSSVRILPSLTNPAARVVPLTVQVEPTKLRAVRLGGGVEFDATKADAHLLAGWEDHNLLGGLRDLSITLKPGVAFYPTSTSNFAAPKRFFPEERLRVQFRQPAFLESRTTAFVQPEFNVYPLLVETDPSEANAVVGYVEPKASLGVERRFGRLFFAKLIYNLQGELPFDYYVPPGSTSSLARPPSVLLSFPQLILQLQLLDDASRPHAGFSANLDVQYAGGLFGGTANDFRIQPDVEAYVPLGAKVTFAFTGSLGLLFPINDSYGRDVQNLPDSPKDPILTNDSQDIQTVYFRGFFSGGPSSNRGFPLRGVSPHGYVPFLNPATARMQVALKCDPTRGVPDPATCSSPIGGFTMWQASAEVRFVISGPIGAAVFCDAGDVSQHIGIESLRFNYPHMSCGVGGRYDTPVGPIRLDIGLRLPWLQILGEPSEFQAERDHLTYGTQPLLAGVPIALAFGLGEAF